MKTAYKSKLYHWVLENFPSGDNSSSTAQMTTDTSTVTNQSLPHSAENFKGNSNIGSSKSGEEELKTKFNGITTFKELKEKTDSYLTELKYAIEQCLKKEATVDSFVGLLDILQKPEVLGILEHMRQELNSRGRDMSQYR
jgi:hypothetical protein